MNCCMSECIDHQPCLSHGEVVETTTSRRHAESLSALEILGSSIVYIIAHQ